MKKSKMYEVTTVHDEDMSEYTYCVYAHDDGTKNVIACYSTYALAAQSVADEIVNDFKQG